MSYKRDNNMWVEGVISGRWVQAKVYDEPSEYGINNGRISKLVISKTAFRNRNANFFNQMDYNYDRGLNFDNMPEGLLAEIVNELESIPHMNQQAI